MGVQQIFTVFENVDDAEVDCRKCGKRIHSFWSDPVGDLISFVLKSRP